MNTKSHPKKAPVFHAAATKKKQTEIKHFNINNKNEKDSALDLWSLV